MARSVYLLPFTLCLLMYLCTLTRVHTFDALSYILDVDRKPWAELFHPHHLAYGPLGALIRSGATSLSWRGSAALLIQATNALAGAAGVTLFFRIVHRLSGQLRLASAGALLLGASYAFWYYAVEVEVYTIAALFLISALGLMVALLNRPTPSLATALGTAQGLAVLFHQTNVLLSVPAGLALIIGSRRLAADPRRLSSLSLRLLIAYLLPLGISVAGAYLWVGLGVSGFRSWEALTGWMGGYARTGWWGGAVNGAKLAGLGLGLSRTLAQPGGALIGVALLGVLLTSLGRLRQAPQGLVALLVAWLLVYGAFFLWWEPDNIEFWIASLPPFYLLLLLGVGGRQQATAAKRESTYPLFRSDILVHSRWRILTLFALGVAMLAINLGAIRQRGDARSDLQQITTAALAERSGHGDLLVVPDGLLELYLPYYAGHEHLISLNQAMAASGGDWAAACALLRARVDLTLTSGYAVVLADTAIRPEIAPPGEPPSMMERFGLTPDQVEACYAPLRPMMTKLDIGADLPGYQRIPTVQELADGPGWDFRRGRWGWHARNTDPARVSDAGWVLTTGYDPALSSPAFQIDAARYTHIEVQMAANTANRDAQIFFLDADGQATEARSLRWELAPGSEMHTYQLDLRDVPGWSGIVYGLRLDPVGVGNAASITVESLRLIQ